MWKAVVTHHPDLATLYCHPRRGYVVIAERSGRILTLARIGDELEG